MKSCSVCYQTKPLEAFPFRNKALGERHAHCKDCQRVKRRLAHERRKASGKERTYYLARQERQRDNWLRLTYGISASEYDALYQAQGGVCAICGRAENGVHGRYGTVRRLAVDHDHATGRVRGLLCGNCNAAIGHLDDDPERLQRAIEYLTRP